MTVVSPRGDKACDRNRYDMNDTMELAKAAGLAKQILVSGIPIIGSRREPSHGSSAGSSNSSSEEVVKEYFDSMTSYVKSEMEVPKLEYTTSASRTKRYFRKRAVIKLGIIKRI